MEAREGEADIVDFTGRNVYAYVWKQESLERKMEGKGDAYMPTTPANSDNSENLLTFSPATSLTGLPDSVRQAVSV